MVSALTLGAAQFEQAEKLITGENLSILALIYLVVRMLTSEAVLRVASEWLRAKNKGKTASACPVCPDEMTALATQQAAIAKDQAELRQTMKALADNNLNLAKGVSTLSSCVASGFAEVNKMAAVESERHKAVMGGLEDIKRNGRRRG